MYDRERIVHFEVCFVDINEKPWLSLPLSFFLYGTASCYSLGLKIYF